MKESFLLRGDGGGGGDSGAKVTYDVAALYVGRYSALYFYP